MVSPAELDRLNSIVFVSYPTDRTTRPDPSAPSIILLFGWFAAQLLHESKYADIFRALYPTSTIVLVEIENSWLWSTQAKRETLLEPVADILDSAKRGEGSKWRGLLLHVMSNGGGMQLLVLSKLLAKRPSVGGLDPVALALDSLPDSNGLRGMVVVFTQSVRNPLARMLAVPVLAALYGLFAAAYGRPSVLPELRARLLSPALVPLAAPDAARIPRLYLASRADATTRWPEVEKHIVEARRRGLDVRVEAFEHTPHVLHAKYEPERYWQAVQDLWRDASQRHHARARL